MGYIYLITNLINGKVYVGKTTGTLENRWKQHVEAASRNIDTHLYRAIRKYGAENFKIESLYYGDENLNELERYYIKQYNSFQNPTVGYNETRGGDGIRLYDYKEIYNLWNQGLSIAEIQDIMNCHYKTVRSALDSYNISQEETTIRGYQYNGKIRKKRIFQYSLDGQLLAIYNDLTEMSRATGYDQDYIRKACNGIYKTAHGFIWGHEEENVLNKKESIQSSKTKIPICQYDLDGNFIQEFDSHKSAAEACNVGRDAIDDAASGKALSCKGFLWKDKKDSSDIQLRVIAYKNNHQTNKKQVYQYDLEGNILQIYESTAAAARALEKPNGSSQISKACRGLIKTAYNSIWSYKPINTNV